MEFRLLGPLQVVVDGAPVALGGSAERALLALLLLDAGRVVPAERLIDTLWGVELPAKAANALQGRVSRLRSAFRTADNRRRSDRAGWRCQMPAEREQRRGDQGEPAEAG